MNILLRYTENTQDLKVVLQKIRELTNGEAFIKDYGNFITVRVDTSLDSKYNSIFIERHYLRRDYCISLFLKKDDDKEVLIPLEMIDTIYTL